MTEIKFRAYNKADKGICLSPMQEMNSAGEFDFDICGNLASSYRLAGAVESDGVEVMQYTGIKDKNGVEIYEGDVLSADGEYDSVVKFGGGAFCIQHITEWQSSWVSVRGIAMDRYEVIGNIHENPELLEIQGGKNDRD